MQIESYTNYKPVIKVYINKDLLKDIDINNILWGIEEEGIPYEVSYELIENAIELGYKASIESPLGVGIGVDKDYIVLHYNKLEKNTPIFIIKRQNNPTKIRSLGANAARLVIKMPFKEV